MFVKKAVTAFALLIALTVATAQASDLWFHVTIHEASEDANVTVNLPLAFIEKALALIPAEATESGNIMIGDEQFDAQKLRELWQSVQGAQDMNFVTIASKDENLVVSKKGNYLTIKGTANSAEGANIDVRMPSSVVNALLDTQDNSLNLAAALQALAAEGEGELATVTGDDAHVRVWIDRFPEAP
jgi:hypothetical protein